MQPGQTIDPATEPSTLEVVVGVFPTSSEASRVAASLRGPNIRMQRVSRRDPAAPNEMPDIIYDDIDEIDSNNIAEGALAGGAIGAGSGLLLVGLPTIGPALAIAASFAGFLAGAWVGGVAGIDEANRGIELPGKEDYQQKLAAGKSIVIIAGDEALRCDYGARLDQLGAEEVHQHPPVHQSIR